VSSVAVCWCVICGAVVVDTDYDGSTTAVRCMDVGVDTNKFLSLFSG